MSLDDWIRRHVSGIVLNGGQSRRMGRDKASLRIAGRAILDRTLEVLGSLFGELLVVGRPVPSVPLTHHVSRIARHVPDAVLGVGPLGGIYSGLLAMSRPYGFFVACDMPCLDRAVIRRQLGLLRERGADALVPAWDGLWEPLHAAYSQECLPAARRQLESGDFRIRGFFAHVNVRFWDVRAEGLSPRPFANVNTKGDLVALFGPDPQWRTD
ncbi:MAG TPA: molybdenum cofactor guanylyltransferase [Planctomycetota bacterium]|nr:molybdenum cofactor guanylyltransferase [Planctomycetota bacterium]HRR83231.1 molybdenum cofactor guanylyltransferase [Planctomycetota bacterium]HRT96898.1 molybdenum cofactor guanylyltransferase [Planctomycetota bacterium]